tara:strand:- start:19137 stop:19553 length:417 start_codon:yes stop_codon:yes gene_type:complete
MNKNVQVGDTIKIVKAMKPSYWYVDRIGEEFEVSGILPDNFIVYTEDLEGACYVSKEDCILVSTTNHSKQVPESRYTSSINEIEVFDEVGEIVSTIMRFDEHTASVQIKEDYVTNADEWTNISFTIHKALVDMGLYSE